MKVLTAVPILFVRDVRRAARYYEERLGFKVDFLHGEPPFYGSVSRDDIRLHLRHVARPNFVELAGREPSLILATSEVSDIEALFDQIRDLGAELAQPLVEQDWGGTDFQVRDLDGNVISFVQHRRGTGELG